MTEDSISAQIKAIKNAVADSVKHTLPVPPAVPEQIVFHTPAPAIHRIVLDPSSTFAASFNNTPPPAEDD